MDGNGQQGQEGQRHMMDQQQQGGWYGAAQHNPYQVPQAYKWPTHDSSVQHYAQPPAQPYGQPDYYMQPQQYAPPLHQAQAQAQQPQHHGHMYVQQEQVWPANNGWNQPQWNYQGASTGSEEEDWAAKARAWATAKAAQEAAQQAQLQAQAQAQVQVQPQIVMSQPEQNYQDYTQQPPQPSQRLSEAARPPTLQPPGQEASHSFSHEAPTSFVQEAHSFPQETTTAYGQEDAPPSFTQEGAPSAYTQAGHAQVVPSSYPQDVSSSYGQDTAHAAPPGTEQHEQSNLQLPRPPPAPVLQQQQSQPSPLPAQVSPLPQPQQFSYQDSAPLPPFDFHQHQQFDFQQPPSQDYQQQPSTPYIPPAPSMPSIGMDGSDMNFGSLQSGMSVWPPLGGPGISFPPGIGPGGPGSHPGPQFDHPHHNHPHHHTHSMHGHQPPNMFPRPHGPPHGPGFRSAGPPLGGAFGFGGSPSLGQGPPGAGVGPVFLPDSNGSMGAPDRPKKAPVPSWLREELLKKKPAVGTFSEDFVQANGSEPAAGSAHKLGASDRTRSDSSGPSDNDEDDEDEVEAARTAQMNQEIKRVLTEVLLKVTDDLFDEIAQEIIDEDEQADEGQSQKPFAVETDKGEILRSNSSPSPPAAPSRSAPARVLVAPAKRSRAPSEDDSDSMSSGAPVGNVLGLASYASDDEGGERGPKPSSTSIDPEVSEEPHNQRGKTEERRTDQRGFRVPEDDGNFEERKGREADGVLPADSDRKEKKDKESGRDKEKRDGESDKKDRERERKEKKSKEADRERDKKDGGGEKREKEREKERVRDREGRPRDKAVDNEEKKKEVRSESKGRKRSNEDSNSSDQYVRSPRRARHGEADRMTTISDHLVREKADCELSGRPHRSGSSWSQVADLKDDRHGDSGLRVKGTETHADVVEQEERSSSAGQVQGVIATKEHNKADLKLDRHSKESKLHASDEMGVSLSGGIKGRVENSDTLARKVKEVEDGNKDHERSKHLRSRDGDREQDGKAERSREKTRDKERERDSDKPYGKDKTRESDRGADREKSKVERGKGRGRTHDRERRKGEKDRSERGREKRKDSRDSKRSKRRSSSASSRGRSPSSSHGSSSGDNRTKSPKQRRLGRSSRRPSVSRSPVRFRRRSSRSRSRSPPSKYSHRRHSPSPSRESDRHR